jgi:hypothetical protein
VDLDFGTPRELTDDEWNGVTQIEYNLKFKFEALAHADLTK